jgi:UMF1 family MFS transporter
LYDWANSSYPLVITSAVFPIYYANVASHEERLIDGEVVDIVRLFGFEFINTELYSYAFSFSFLIVSFLAPILSGIADYAGNKKVFLQFFCYLGAASCASLYWFNADYLEWGMLSVVLASIGFWGSIVFYNAYLPQIAKPEDHDRISAKGFSLGYVGSVILLLSIILAQGAGLIEWKDGFVAVGIWWAGFAQVTYATLPKPRGMQEKKHIATIVFNGYRELRKVWKEFQQFVRLKRYLLSYFVYSMGVQTVMLMAVIFGNQEINWPDGDTSGLIIAVLIIQLIGAVGAAFFARLSKRTSNLLVLKIILFIWIFICMMAYYIHEPIEFYVLAAIVGFVMGGVQSMSRSTYSKFLPETEDHASYFSFFDVLEKIGIVIGTFFFGYIQGVTGDMRDSVLVIILFFVLGFLLLLLVPRNERLVKS